MLTYVRGGQGLRWPSNWLRPNRQKYKEFENQLAKRSSKKNLESGLLIFLAMLFAIPAVIALMFALMYVLGR
jgi:hypothetical protein